MSLYSPPSTGDFLPYLKYNAKAGRCSFKNDEGEKELTNPEFVADFENVEKAWMFYMEGQAPDIVKFPDLTAQVPKPSDDHKLGIILKVYSKNLFGGLAEFSSNSMLTCSALNELYEKYDQSKSDNAGKLPVVKFTGATPEKGKYGTNYKPVFEITKWVDRPADFDEVSVSNDTAPAPAPQSSASEF